MAECTSLPVLMYHYVSRCIGPINVTPERFAEQCRGMAENGWRGVSLEEAEAYFLNGTALPKKSVLITFDDGFLDNAVYAWPILKKYGHCGVVFVVTDRLEKGPLIRPTLEDVWNKSVDADSLPPVDNPQGVDSAGISQRADLFMNWAEARRVDQSGVLTVAAHTATHTLGLADRTFPPNTGNSYAQAEKRFHAPTGHGNTFYRLYQSIPWGTPLFREQPAMLGPGFVPAPELLAHISALVPQSKAEARAFFEQPDNVSRLHQLVDTFAPDALGSMETEEAFRLRVSAELDRCRQALETGLGHPVRSLCWPWGSASPAARDEAQKLGFSVFYDTRPGANPPGKGSAVRRFKVRDKGWAWLKTRLEVYSRPVLAALYTRFKSY